MATASVMSFLFLVICSAYFVNAVFGLRCRVEHDEETQRSFQDIVRTCLSTDFRKEETNNNHHHRNNNNNWGPRPGNNMNDNWQRGNGPQWAGIPRFPTKDPRDRNNREDGEDGDSRDDNNGRTNNNYNYNNNNNSNRGSGGGRPRVRRAAGIASSLRGGRVANDTFARRMAEGSPLEEVEPCVIHCIFRQMQMLGEDNEPERGAVERAMTSRLRDRRLREFIRDAISECFDSLEQENQDMKCSVSKTFALCLEQKGQQNCEDWEDEIKRPTRPKQGGMNFNKHRG